MEAANKDEKFQKIKDQKASEQVLKCCSSLPPEFKLFFKYIKKLGYEEKPDYCYLRELFYRRLVMEGSDLDNVYDWVLNPKFLRKPIPF